MRGVTPSSSRIVAVRCPTTPCSDVFKRMLEKTGLTHAAKGGRHPRIHDLRHSFAVRSLEACGPDRRAIARHMVGLSTYLGHVRISDTYWYLEATPFLLQQIAERGEALLDRGAR